MIHWCGPQFMMTHETCSTCSIQFQIREDGIIQTSPVVLLGNIKGPGHMVEGDRHLRKRPQPQPTAFRQVCKMMIKRQCNVQTNKYDLQAKMYPIICTHDRGSYCTWNIVIQSSVVYAMSGYWIDAEVFTHSSLVQVLIYHQTCNIRHTLVGN